MLLRINYKIGDTRILEGEMEHFYNIMTPSMEERITSISLENYDQYDIYYVSPNVLKVFKTAADSFTNAIQCFERAIDNSLSDKHYKIISIKKCKIGESL